METEKFDIDKYDYVNYINLKNDKLKIDIKTAKEIKKSEKAIAWLNAILKLVAICFIGGVFNLGYLEYLKMTGSVLNMNLYFFSSCVSCLVAILLSAFMLDKEDPKN